MLGVGMAVARSYGLRHTNTLYKTYVCFVAVSRLLIHALDCFIQ
jgi:hypothetical protein